MLTCLYKGKQICAYDVTNANYALNYGLKKEWRLAGRNRELICQECGKEVQLRVNDPRKKVPHFSHKLTDNRCPFSNNDSSESEEHKKAKMLLYNYFREKYIGTRPIINYRFTNRRKADLCIEFNNGDKLAVEYQRTNLDIVEWQERHDEYKKASINDLWLIGGKEDNIKIKEKQVEVTFFQQIMLNELGKVAVHLDVNSVKLIFAKNMRYSDPFVINNDFEELYIKSYNLNDVLILTNGKIDCDFSEEYKKASEKFINHYSKRCLDEENLRNRKVEEENRQAKLVKKMAEETLYNTRQRESKLEIKSKEIPNRYFKDKISNGYRYKINNAINGDAISIESIARYLRDNGCSDNIKIITLICKYHYLKGNIKAKEVYGKIMEEARFDCGNLEVSSENLNELECPFCKGKLKQKYGKFGAFVSCDNYPECKFIFNIK